MPKPSSKKPPAPRTVRRVVSSPRNSACDSARLADLDWSDWWTDHSLNQNYLHVAHKDGETVHRVHCRATSRPRLSFKDGKLSWLYTEKEKRDHPRT